MSKMLLSSTTLLTLVALFGQGHSAASPANVSMPTQNVYEKGPAITSNFPDPCIVNYGGTYHVFATKTQIAANETINIQIATSLDFQEWTLLVGDEGAQVDALPNPPAWVDQSMPNTWAPDIVELNDGTFVMYFSAATKKQPRHHCIGTATAPKIVGPYTPTADPLFCPLDEGGAIDAAGFRDWGQRDFQLKLSSPKESDGGAGGQRYVVYKVDGNSLGSNKPTPLRLQAVGLDGMTPTGPTYTLLDNQGASDSGVVEAPSLVKSANGTYVLFFSSGNYGDSTYTVSYATSNSLFGNFTRQPVLLKTGSDDLYSPGGLDILYDAKHVVFHADEGTTPKVRQLYVGEVQIVGDQVLI